MLNHTLIVIAGIFYNVSFFMVFYIFFLCFNYVRAVIRLNKKALHFEQQSGLLSQTDIKMAAMITKDYKMHTNYDFTMLRNQVWKAQFFLVFVAAVVGFITTIVPKYKDKLLTIKD